MFMDRTDAGHRLAIRMAGYSRPRPLVLALPRGGAPVAVEVASTLDAEFDVLVVRKLGAPGNPEFAIGAVGENGVIVVDDEVRRRLGVTDVKVATIEAEQRRELDRRVLLYRGDRPSPVIATRDVILVDDGLATGSTAAAGVTVLRHLDASHVTVAVPVASAQALQWMREIADDVVCLEVPEPFFAVGQHYADFGQVSDDEVIAILTRHGHL